MDGIYRVCIIIINIKYGSGPSTNPMAVSLRPPIQDVSFVNLFQRQPSYIALYKMAHLPLADKRDKSQTAPCMCVPFSPADKYNKGKPKPFPSTPLAHPGHISEIPKFMLPFPHHFFSILPLLLVRGRIILIKTLCPFPLVFNLGDNRPSLSPFIHTFPVYPVEELVGFNCADAAGNVAETM